MERVYKGVGGYKVWEEGDDKHPPTHYLFTNHEEEITRHNEIVGLKNKLYYLKQDMEKERDDAARTLKKEKDRLNKIISELKSQLEKEEELNRHLLRINREKANSARRLQPKKEKSGFMIREMKESMVKRGKDREERCFVTTIETPYSIDIPISVLDPVALKRDRFAYLYDVYMDDDHDKMIDNVAYGSFELEGYKCTSDKLNVVFRRDWKTGRRGFWELIIWHSKPFPSFEFGILLPTKPEDMVYLGEDTGEHPYYRDPRDNSEDPQLYRLDDGRRIPWTKNKDGGWEFIEN